MRNEEQPKRLRLQDVADMIGVSRTTVSNVLHGKTKKVSIETIQKVSKLLDEQGYVPNMSSRILASNVSKIIGVVLSAHFSHGIYPSMDPFVGEFIGAVEDEARKQGYYIMMIQGLSIEQVADVASRWNIDGLVVLFYKVHEYAELKRKLNKHVVLVDTYDRDQYDKDQYKESEKAFYNVGIDDYYGGRLIGRYLAQKGYGNALFAAETKADCDYVRWLGFKYEMEVAGFSCDDKRYIHLSQTKEARIWKISKIMPDLIEKHKAIAFSSDYNAAEAINYFVDQGIKVPEQISVTGFDGNVFSEMIRPRLTTVKQDVTEKGKTTVNRLIELINKVEPEKYHIRLGVELVEKDSVK